MKTVYNSALYEVHFQVTHALWAIACCS